MATNPRRQVTAFLPGPVGARIDEVRARWDPDLAGRIRAHVTIVHDAAALDDPAARLAEVAAGHRPFGLRIGGARCWDGPEAGIYLDVGDEDGAVASIRAALGVTDPPGVEYVPHVTVVHPAGAAAERARDAWDELRGWELDEQVVIGGLALIELRDGRWQTVQRARLRDG